ncbi:RNA-directed DNA polymerase from transposon X-element, partial [Paramuricea clavata]
MHDIELNPGPTNQTHENGCFDPPKKTKGLIIGHLNIRSIKCATKLDEIKALLIRKPTIHVISFSETWLNDSWPDDMLYIPNYTFIRLDRSSNTSGGGIITYIHNDVPFTHRSDLGSENIETTCIEVKPHYVSPILLLNVYRPPSADSSHDYCLTEIMERVASENKECCVLGDFNMNVLCQKSKSSVFLKRIHQLRLKQLVTVPTRTEARYVNGSFSVTSTLIDHIYCSSERNVASIHVPPLSLSDYYPVFLVRRCNASMRSKQNEKSTIQYRSLSNLNKTDFREDLRLPPWSSIEAFDDPSDAL